MKTIIVLSAAILAAGCIHNGGPEANARAQAQAAKDEATLAAALSGRIAGPPQDCVSQGDLGGNKSFGRGVILFSGRVNDVVYVNRPPAGCPDLDFGRALKTRTTTTQLCRGDIVTVFDPSSGTEYGGCSLGEFTPYRRAR
ncbi:MAG: hypothetical protein ABR961_09375 [Thermoanaerobaculaceae bacterium]|jgi:hypothetical protein